MSKILPAVAATLLVGVVFAADLQAGIFHRRHVEFAPRHRATIHTARPGLVQPSYGGPDIRVYGRPYMPQFWRDVDGYGES